MEIKVHCGCGARYKFDLVPVNGRMPFAVNCPVCGVSGTEKANQSIRETLAKPPEPEPGATKSRVVPLRVISAEETRTSEGEKTPSGSAKNPFTTPLSIPPAPSGPTAESATPTMDWLTGAVCGVLAATLGFGIWYGLSRWLGFQLGWVAWGVGWLTALGARAGARRPCRPLGVAAALSAAAAIVAGQWICAEQAKLDAIRVTARQAVEVRLAEASEATNLRSEPEIRSLLSRRNGGSAPTVEQVRAFREKELPELREFLDSALSRSDYERSFITTRQAETSTFLTLARQGGLLGVLWIFLGVFTAYRVARG